MNAKTKIVATLGPATSDEKILSKLINIGLSVARLNMSHGSHEEHKGRIDTLKRASKSTGVHVATLLDLSGPKIRTGDIEGGSMVLRPGTMIELVFSPTLCTPSVLYINYPKLKNELKKGDRVLLDDGKRELEVVSVSSNSIKAKVLVGGMIRSRRGVNLPGTDLSISAITEKDKKDLAFGVKEGVDFVALSFVRNVKDVYELRKLLAKHKSDAKIISKIETPQAIEDIDSIIRESDGIMVARGDLAVEVGIEKIPSIQKSIIKKCNDLGKPVIVATQMLLTMVENEVPTRAEVSDIANAIYDGADAIMLSEETAVGKHPVKAVEVMRRVSLDVEAGLQEYRSTDVARGDMAESVSASVVHNAAQLGAKAIVAMTQSGFTARIVSKYKPSMPVYAISSSLSTIRKLMLSWGVVPIYHKGSKTFEEARVNVASILKESKHMKKGDTYILSAGLTQGKSGTTNLMLIEKM